MSAWVVLGLGFGYLWNRARKFKVSIEDGADTSDIQSAKTQKLDATQEMSEDLPTADKNHLVGIAAKQDDEVAMFNGSTGDITGVWMDGGYG